MFEERYSDTLRINLKKIRKWDYLKTLRKKEQGSALLPKEEIPPILLWSWASIQKKKNKKPEWTFFSTENELPSLINIHLQ